eukprot:441905-Hanusia_phi.AAC.2
MPTVGRAVANRRPIGTRNTARLARKLSPVKVSWSTDRMVGLRPTDHSDVSLSLCFKVASDEIQRPLLSRVRRSVNKTDDG